MTIRGIAVFAVLLFMIVGSVGLKEASAGSSSSEDPDRELLAAFADCLTEQGWVMYGSFTCSACRAQRKAFGEAFSRIREVECNPHAPNSKVELCLQKKIKKTPTWIQEKNGQEVKRFEGYKLLEDIAATSGCGL